MRTLTLDRLDALTPEQVDASAALAMGWEPYYVHAEGAAGGWPPSWTRGGVGSKREDLPFECRFDPPPYYTCPADAPDRWKWWGEMIEALVRRGWEISINATETICGHEAIDAEAEAATPRALVRALCAAGRLFEPSDLCAAGRLEEADHA
ncbi:MAG TPA: hypothetical protein VM695_10080 [Phycisphaerae bacterium]|nr:hypothetical protein [Phycisphaerae bacterium]